MGLFGRKKKEAGIIEEAEDNENEQSLDLAYGNCLDETSHRNEGDSSSVGGDSLPPPPPHKKSSKQKNRSHDDTFDEDHSEHDSLEEAIEVNDPSIETAIPRGRSFRGRDSDDMSNISVTFEPDYVVKGGQNRRRNKLLLMLACCLGFCVVIGLAAGYGSSAAKNKQQEQSSSFSELNSSESEVNVDTGVADADATIADVAEEEEGVPTNVMSTEEQDVSPPEGGAAAPQQQETTDETATAEKNIVPNVVTAPTDPSNSIETVIDNTDLTSSTTPGDGGIPATTTDTYTNTQGSNSNSNSNGMPATTGTAVPSMYTSTKWVDPDACTVDQITASSHCENGIASTSIFMCLGRDTRLNDQFWAWSEVPLAYQAYQDRDWGWLGDYDASRNREITGLPNGRYVLGLYADGNGPVLEQYPLLASSEFTIACGG
mmetsp:Transcript_673/g.815  ORF Transcript_673/g.815 Transcript_673/m.815 type:complete len:430 (-) Transcript_673:121-1410(-)